jgi:hypothetical protein
MAYIFPNSSPTILPPEALRVFRFLKTLPDEIVIWHHLAPWQKDAPDFLLLDDQRHALLLKVSSAAASAAHPAAQLLLLDGEQAALGETEAHTLQTFIARLPEAMSKKIATSIVFPSISEKQLRESRPSAASQQPAWFGQEALQPGAVDLAQPLTGQPALEAAEIEHLRVQFTPEIVVPRSMTVRTPSQRRLEAGLTDYLLDYNQEAALKAELDLSQDARGLVKDFRLNVINGVAGSGKTLILLYRLRLLQGLYPGKRFLVLTHNRPLIHDMQARYRLLHGSLPPEIEWRTFNSWCRVHWPAHPAWVAPIGETKRQALIQQVWQEVFAGASITPGMLRSEIDWIKDQVLSGREDYLGAPRSGRGFRLTQEQRQRMFDAVAHYQNLLHQQGYVDWGDVPRRLWKLIRDGKVAPPLYDVILVDEAQFFAPLWFDLLRALVRPRSGHLFLVADPTQGFLGRGASWKSLGLDVRGHSQQLQRSYRTTREILSFATLFYRQRIEQDEAEDEVLTPDLFNLPSGAVPEILPMSSSQDEIARVANEIQALAQNGLPLAHLLVLHVDWLGAEHLIKAIQKRLGPKSAADPKTRLPGEFVRVTTINAGAGLESPIVFLVGLNQLFEAEQSLRLSDEEREKLVGENTRKVYMAATRAGQRLVVSYVGELPADLTTLIQPARLEKGSIEK